MLNAKSLPLRKFLSYKLLEGGNVLWAMRVPHSLGGRCWGEDSGDHRDIWSDLVQPLASSYVTVTKNPLCICKNP